MKFIRDIDRIRIKPRRQARLRRDTPVCEWDGCTLAGEHRAPKAPNQLREYRWFCMEHARAYNRSWNFFDGMSESEVRRYIKGNATGHRPTWSMGAQKGVPGDDRWGEGIDDAFDIFGEPSGNGRADGPRPAARRRFPPRVVAAFESLGLEQTATLHEVRVRYKELVKRFHPDANGGDRTMEGRLEQVIQAYNHLKASGIE